MATVVVAVLGATGGTGLEVVKQALAAGHGVRALVRSPEKLAVKHDNLTVVKGDALNEADVDAVRGGGPRAGRRRQDRDAAGGASRKRALTQRPRTSGAHGGTQVVNGATAVVVSLGAMDDKTCSTGTRHVVTVGPCRPAFPPWGNREEARTEDRAD